MNLLIRPAKSLIDFEYIRRIRNANLGVFTADNRRISIPRQVWFMLTKKPSIDLYIAQFEGRRCGYLLLRRHSKTTWITEVVEEKFRRKGIAGEIIGFAVATKLELSAEILNSNKASIRLHERAGFVQVEKFNSFGRYVLSPTKGSSK